MKLKYYTDPGHGWVPVKRTLLRQLGILDRISSFSYQRGGTVYLEEDCDATLLIEALERHGIEREWTSTHTNRRHPIRSYEPFTKG